MSSPGSPRLRRAIVILGCGLIALVCAVANYAHVSIFPPGISARHIEMAVATTRVAVDFPAPLMRNADADDGTYQNLQKRSVLVANLMSSEVVMQRVARHAGIPAGQIAATTRVMVDVQPAMLEPDSERRAAQLADAKHPYEVEIRPDPRKPTMTIYAQAPTVAEAERLAEAALPGVREYLAELALRHGAGTSSVVRLDQLGSARGAIVNGGTGIEILGLTFLFCFAMAYALAVALSRLMHGQTSPRRRTPEEQVRMNEYERIGDNGAARGRIGAGALRAMTGTWSPALALPYGHAPARPAVPATSRAGRLNGRAIAARGSDWPRTTRVLPWLVAAFMVVIWLVPFNEIELAISLPVDLKFDRLVLPVLAGVWALVLATGGPDAPSVRFTPIHLAVGGMVAMACLSLVLSAHSLTRTLEFDFGVKKLTLLISYAAMFVIVASVIRRSELRAFMTFTLVLASICAFGTIVEYRFNFNLFFFFADRALPGLFSIGEVTPDGVDEIGRRLIRGPAQVSLETVAMLAMAMPIAIVRVIHAEPGQRRWINALIIALLMAAMVSTFRKTALIAPVSVCLTIAYFRRRELLKLAPLGIVLILVIQVLSPGALTGVASQLDRSRLGVTTVSDRTADYDAIRPDVWTNMVFGRGYGSYTHQSYRLLDMEMLRQIIEVGVIGLLIYVALAITVIAVARPSIRARGPDAPVALAVAAAAVGFLVVSTLFDVMSFPHVPYIFLWLAAVLSVLTSTRESDPGSQLEPRWNS